MNNLKIFLKGFLFLNILVLALLLTNLIPQSAITKNIKKSYEYYENLDTRIEKIGKMPQSMDDTITDLIILNLAYNEDPNNVLTSTLLSEYYFDDQYELGYNEQLKLTVFDGVEPNTSYSRYWHGYMVIARTLLLFFDMNTIKIIIFAIYLLLIGLLFIVSIKKDMIKFSILYLISAILGTLFFEFFTFGHLAPVFISLIGCLYVMYKDSFNERLLFLNIGISVAFFDFLSTEILTLTLPLICLLMKYHKNDKKLLFKDFVWLNANWLMGYMFTYIYKWILIALFCGKEYLIDAYEKGVEKVISKDALAGLSLNIQMLFPGINFNIAGMNIFAVILTSIVIFIYIFHKQGCNKNKVITYLIFIFAIPYIRYIVLSNHGFVHYFFTYRSQVSSIMALLLMMTLTLDLQFVKKILVKQTK